ncbi:co-chaperone GroES [Thalassoroseus pseudoceratinae]|uniref:co-chaperone GroES n=1 Tax=Thalassoroseus pseudoceratinae TaxID=2713176 RepID=UPI00141F90A4|nr:co-chaperone GroES [Thalassoroseus pseudoceratinae]
MKIVPLGDKVVIQRIEAEAVTAGGLVLPDDAQKQATEGRVLSVGAGVRRADGTVTPFQVKEGDRVMFTPWAGTEIDIDGEPLLIASESDILVVLTP